MNASLELADAVVAGDPMDVALRGCDWLAGVGFVVGCCVLLNSAYPEHLLQLAEELARPPCDHGWLHTYFTGNGVLLTTQASQLLTQTFPV